MGNWKKKVAIIGAGGAGLCAARHMKETEFEPVIFEQNCKIGGQWNYEEVALGQSDTEIFSSVYQNLKTNLPKQIMLFPDFPFPDEWPSYLHHTKVFEYIEKYAEHFDLLKFIHFQRKVVKVVPLVPDHTENVVSGFVEWKVSVEDLLTGEVEVMRFEAVIVCSGNFSIPNYPEITDIKYFKGKQVHSHLYRRPDEFHDQNVCVLGAGPSGYDIAIELSDVATNIYLSHRGPRLVSKLPSNLREMPGIKHVAKNGEFVFEDGRRHRIDAFIACTGYKYCFPFLDTSCEIEVEEFVIRNLYKHLFNIRYPSMALVGILQAHCIFATYHQQCYYLKQVLTREKQLPIREEMKSDTDQEFQQLLRSGEPEKNFHKMFLKQFPYVNLLAELSGLEKNPVVIEKIYRCNSKRRKEHLLSYKSTEFRVVNDDEFVVLDTGGQQIEKASYKLHS